jgi:hypothetical protein
VLCRLKERRKKFRIYRCHSIYEPDRRVNLNSHGSI